MARGRQGRMAHSAPAPAGIEALRTRVEAAAPRIARIGYWPEWIAPASLVERVPVADQQAAGFDAGIACALEMIPRGAQELSACLHAAYTPQAVERVREEAPAMDPDAQTTWWLAACSICREGEIGREDFLAQVAAFQALVNDPAARRAAAIAEHRAMLARFTLRPDGLAMAHADGGMQGAYLAGHGVSAMAAPAQGLFFVGTYLPSLGLEDFPWAEPAEPDSPDPERRRGRSGPVHGSRQFVKCTDDAELERVVVRLREGGLLDGTPPA